MAEKSAIIICRKVYFVKAMPKSMIEKVINNPVIEYN
jgi:hypothetical protein